MLTKLSSKGQLVIPKAIRERLGLEPGTQFQVELVEDKIVLEPILPSPLDALYGKYRGDDFLTELQEEHRQELEMDEETVRP